MKISVIVPVYNVENYLEKCLNSLVNQTLEEIEILVINDGSTDNSQKIIDDFQEKFSQKIKAFSKENGGLSDARNFGIDRASGDFLAFVDSDDYVSETMLQEMYDLAIKNNAEMVICNLQKVDEKGNVTQTLRQIPNMPEKIDLEKNFSVFSDISYFACNKIFKRELFDGKRFQKGMHFEDIELIPQILLQCKTIAKTDAFHYQYFERSHSISKSHTERGLDILKAVENVEKSFENSIYSSRRKELKGFQILEGVYTFLAYMAFVKDERVFNKMNLQLKKFIKERDISLKEIFIYKRFGRNYLLSLPYKKMIYYLLCFFGLETLMRKIL
ncbi:glycosyl transferase [Cloacibacterium rupense]|uniref:Glycosyl transferase n=1 Tax=Cloacibacterium rupense TaxID=517423 RepID=A0ABQ2NLB2_9FLAO|nr:glycosyltransferase [Cloacibacterium rupense]GGP04108.1 glycosyl transferase [Cloacibacterium rupense]